MANLRGFIMRAILALFILGLLQGCTAMSKDECLYADWQAIGYEDGAAGKSMSAVSSRRTACAKKAGVTLDMAAYKLGRDEGLREFCEPSKGYALGARGGYYHGVCVGPDEPAFVAAYEAGRQLYDYERAVASISAQIRQAHYDLTALEHDIAATETTLVSSGPTAMERVELLLELKRLTNDRSDVETALALLERDHDEAQAMLIDYREHLAFDGPYYRGALSPSEASY